MLVLDMVYMVEVLCCHMDVLQASEEASFLAEEASVDILGVLDMGFGVQVHLASVGILDLVHLEKINKDCIKT